MPATSPQQALRVYRARRVARLFARQVFVQSLALRSSQLLERAIVKRGVKGGAGLMQLIDDRDIQLLCSDQHFDFSAPQGGRNCRVKKWLPEGASCKRERLVRRLSSPLPALHGHGRAD